MPEWPLELGGTTRVRDLREKMKYLLKVRGGDVPGWKQKITQQKQLAAALTEMGVPTDEPAIARWRRYGEIPNLALVAPRIAAIFDCDATSFRRDDFLDFVEKTEGQQVSWEQLVAGAEIVGSVAEISSVDHASPALSALNAGPTDLAWDDDNELPRLPRGVRLRATLPVPELKVSEALPERRYVLLFSGDSSGYLNWLPRFRTSKAFRNLERIGPSVMELHLPSPGGEIKLDDQSVGRHEVVLVVSTEPLPEVITSALEAPVINAALKPALDQLTRWLVQRMKEGKAAIRCRPYFVQA